MPFAVLGATSLVSYQRAKAESLGISAKGGLMERAERMILLGIGFLSASFLVPVLWVMLALTMATALGRFVKVWRLAEAPVPAGHATTPPPGADRRPLGRSQIVGITVPVAGPPAGRAVQPVGSGLAGPARPTGNPTTHRPASPLSPPGR